MAKMTFVSNPRVEQIFDELEKFLSFCQGHGYRYDERDLHNWKSYAWQQYSKFAAGKPVKDMWAQDANRRSK